MILVEILIAVILLILLLAFFSPTHWSIQPDIVIDKSAVEIYNYIKILKNSESYNKWVMLDPAMKKEFKGTDGTVGFVYAWDSEMKSVGKGEQEITKLVENQKVEYEIRFFKPFPGVSTSFIELQSIAANQTKVSWNFSSSNTYLMKVFHVLMNLKKVLTKDLEQSLANLKQEMEK